MLNTKLALAKNCGLPETVPQRIAIRWRSPEMVLGILVTFVLLAAWEGVMLNVAPRAGGLAGDFHQFYTAGKIVASGQVDRLYDQRYFRGLQADFRADPLCSLYPPTMGLLMSPLARLSLPHAIVAWWILQLLCLTSTGIILYRTSSIPPPWRRLMPLALAGSLPVWIAIGIGHLAPVLVLFLAGGLALHRQGRVVLAGVVLSVLALKPQLAAGLTLWMLARRDGRTLLGLALGFLLQFILVAVTLGPQRWLDFLHAMPTIAGIIRAYRYSPLFEQSLPGIVCNLAYDHDLSSAARIAAMRITYILVGCMAAVFLCRTLMFTRPLGQKPQGNDAMISCEYACGVLFMMLIPPYFLIYDLTLLIVPIAYLWSSPAWRWGIALYLTTTALVANTAFQLGFSVTVLMIIAVMGKVAETLRAQSALTA